MTGISPYFSNIWGGLGRWGERKNMLVLPDIMLWMSVWYLEPKFFAFRGLHGLLLPMTQELDHKCVEKRQ